MIDVKKLGDESGTDVIKGTLLTSPQKQDFVNHPIHYGGKNNQYEAIKVIRAWGLNFSLGSAVKYISRAGKKDLKGDMLSSTIEDLEKSVFYIQEEISALKKEQEALGYQD